MKESESVQRRQLLSRAIVRLALANNGCTKYIHVRTLLSFDSNANADSSNDLVVQWLFIQLPALFSPFIYDLKSGLRHWSIFTLTSIMHIYVR